MAAARFWWRITDFIARGPHEAQHDPHKITPLNENAGFTHLTKRWVNPHSLYVREISEAERVLASTLAKTIIRRRKELGKTQEQVALEAEMDRNHYQLMEHARSDRKSNYPANPRLNTLIKLARVLDVSVDTLLAEALAAHERVRRETER